MADTPRCLTIKTSSANMAAQRGNPTARYNLPLDIPVVFKWVPGAVDTVDGVTVFGYSGGTAGVWRRLRMPLLGEDLGDEDVTIDPRGNYIRRVPAGTLNGHRVCTLGLTNAVEGDVITVLRLCMAAYTYTIINGGPAAGTLATFPVIKEAFMDAYFDGTNWLKVRAGTML
jgi:hypothetical protein